MRTGMIVLAATVIVLTGCAGGEVAQTTESSAPPATASSAPTSAAAAPTSEVPDGPDLVGTTWEFVNDRLDPGAFRMQVTFLDGGQVSYVDEPDSGPFLDPVTRTNWELDGSTLTLTMNSSLVYTGTVTDGSITGTLTGPGPPYDEGITNFSATPLA